MRARMFWMSALTITLMVSAGCKKKDEGNTPSGESASTSPSGHVPTPPSTTAPTPTANPPTGEPKVTKLTAKLPGDGQPLMDGQPIQLPIIAWGGDFPWVYCAGGIDGTHKGTICEKHGVNIKIVQGDDYAVQLADYRARKTPLLRNTLGTLGKYWETLCKEDPGLCPSPWFIETKSKGDFLTCRDYVKDVGGLVDGSCKDASGQPRKCRIAAMKDGPWDSFLVTVVLEDAKRPDKKPTAWEDVEIVWARDLSGETNSADALFRNDPTVDCTMGITPDMMSLTGGVTSVGSGADKTIKGAHVVTSTLHRRDGGIMDGFAVSTEFTVKDRQWLHAALTAYQEASEELMKLARANANGGNEVYEQAMMAMVNVYPKELKGDPEEANGLYLDAEFLGISGNVAFLDPTNEVGMKYHEKWANVTARLLGTAQGDVKFGNSPIDWKHTAFSGLASKNTKRGSRFKGEATAAELERMSQAGTLGTNAIIRFSARFAVDDDMITDCTPYHSNFAELLPAAKRYSDAPIAIRAHYDPSKMVAEIIMAGMRSGVLKQEGTTGNYRYYINSEEVSLKSIGPWLKLLEDPLYKDAKDSEGQPFTGYIEQARLKSKNRAEALRKCLIEYATSKNEQLDPARVHTEAVGMAEPIVVKGRSVDELSANRRAECTLVKVTGEALTDDMLEL